MSHIETLPEGPIAIIGDIHGELEALDALLSELDTRFPACHLVFLGDLADRGPDSPGVIARVRERMERGAQCVLGNHELSVIRGEDKGYNRWFFSEKGPWEEKTTGRVIPMVTVKDPEREAVEAFFRGLPLALERDDLRIVHACWNAPAISAVKARESKSILEIFDEGPTHEVPEPEDLTRYNGGQFDESTRDFKWEREELRQQNENAIAVLTAGLERPAETVKGDKIVWSGGKWRPLLRDRWWDNYAENVPVVIGHYSRKWDVVARKADEKSELMFPGESPGAPRGLRSNVYAIDYAVGQRFLERANGSTGSFTGRLAALLWDVEETPCLLFDDGETVPAVP